VTLATGLLRSAGEGGHGCCCMAGSEIMLQ
jgi:hypothetical protein